MSVLEVKMPFPNLRLLFRSTGLGSKKNSFLIITILLARIELKNESIRLFQHESIRLFSRSFQYQATLLPYSTVHWTPTQLRMDRTKKTYSSPYEQEKSLSAPLASLRKWAKVPLKAWKREWRERAKSSSYMSESWILIVERTSHKPRIRDSNSPDQSVGELDGTWLYFKVLIPLESTKAGCEWR